MRRRSRSARLPVLIIDHAAKLAEKIRISGGGRCFTNLDVGVGHYLSRNPTVLLLGAGRFTPGHFIERGTATASDGTSANTASCSATSRPRTSSTCWQSTGCDDGHVSWAMPCTLERSADRRRPRRALHLDTSHGRLPARTSSLPPAVCRFPRSAPRRWVIDRRTVRPRRRAAQAGPRAADAAARTNWRSKELAGMAFDAVAECGADASAREPAVHPSRPVRPVILQVSSHWQARITAAATATARSPSICSWPKRPPVADGTCPQQDTAGQPAGRPSAQALLPTPGASSAAGTNRSTSSAAKNPMPLPRRLELDHRANGRRSAKVEVTLGGVDTGKLIIENDGSAGRPGLYFVGEVMDVTGHRRLPNFQWAWARPCGRQAV